MNPMSLQNLANLAMSIVAAIGEPSRAIPLLALFAPAPAARADKVVLVAGGGDGPDGSPATQAKLVAPFAVDFAADGSLLFVEMTGGERLRQIAADGTLTTLAGTG